MESKKSFKALPTKKEFLRTALFQEQVQIDYDDRGVGFRLLCLSSGRLVLLICSPWQSIADQQISTSNAELALPCDGYTDPSLFSSEQCNIIT